MWEKNYNITKIFYEKKPLGDVRHEVEIVQENVQHHQYRPKWNKFSLRKELFGHHFGEKLAQSKWANSLINVQFYFNFTCSNATTCNCFRKSLSLRFNLSTVTSMLSLRNLSSFPNSFGGGFTKLPISNLHSSNKSRICSLC